MPVEIRGSRAIAVNGTTTITLPNGTVAGDLMLISLASQNAATPMPTGWTELEYATVSNNYTNHHRVGYKIATASDISTGSVTYAPGSSAYYGVTIVSLYGHDPANPIGNDGSATVAGTNLTTGSLVTTRASRRFGFFSIMANTNPPNASLSVPTGTATQQATSMAANYATLSVSGNAEEAAGTLSGYSTTSNVAGALIGVVVAVNVYNAAPVITTATTQSQTLLVSQVNRFSWAFSDVESNPQVEYEIKYRKKFDSLWQTTGVITNSNQYHDFAVGTFEPGEYMWNVAISDGFSWSTPVSGYFRATEWNELTEFSSSSTTGVIDASSLQEGPVDVQVRVADANGWGAWSDTQTFTLGPASNIMVLQGGVWVQAENLVKEGGAFKIVSPTARSYDGFFKDGPLTTFTTSSPGRYVPYDMSMTSSMTVLFSGKFETQDTDALGLWMEFTPDTNVNNGFYLTNKAQDSTPGYFDIALANGPGIERVRVLRPANGVSHDFAIVLSRTAPVGQKIAVFIDGVKQTNVQMTTAPDMTGNFANSNLFVMSRNGSALKTAGEVSNTPILVARAYTDAEAVAATN